MKVLLLSFILFFLAPCQALPTNSTADLYESDFNQTDFRKCVWEQCSFHNCSCEYILSEKLITYNDDKLGTCVSKPQFCNMMIDCNPHRINDELDLILSCESYTNSSTRMVFENSSIQYTFWIIGFFVIAGNAYVIVRSFIKTSCFKKAWPSASLQCNHIVILNIAVADFIMGIYLITISILNALHSRNTHLQFLEWTASLGCSVLGSLSVISSEASCFLMVTLTSFRLFHVYQPLSSMTASNWPWKACIFMSWFVAVFLGVFPILNSSDYFVLYYVMKNNFSETFITGKNLFELVAFSVTSLDGSNYSNHEFEQEIAYMKAYFPRYLSRAQFENSFRPIPNLSYEDYRDQRDMIKVVSSDYFSYIPESRSGFYSSSSICLPTCFNLPSLSGWEYSIALIALNFACFIFIAVSYILIYTRSTKKRPINAASTVDLRKREAKMQKRIARIIMTDFACWVPICIMVFTVFADEEMMTNFPIIDEIIAGFLLPINSALNPFLYSISLSKLFKRLRCPQLKDAKN